MFGIATMLIGIPTGVKIYDWMLTMFRGRVRFTVPMLYSLGFILLFVLGGMTGILLANPAVDYQVHNTLFPGRAFPQRAGPRHAVRHAGGLPFLVSQGFRLSAQRALGHFLRAVLDRRLHAGVLSALWVGLMGLPRRTVAYSDPPYVPYMIVAFLGAASSLRARRLVVQLWVSIHASDELRFCRRSVGRAQPGMVDLRASAGIQLFALSRVTAAMRSRCEGRWRAFHARSYGDIECRRTARWA